MVKVGYGNYSPDNRIDSSSTDLDCSKPCLRAPKWTSGVAPTDIKITVRKDTVMVPVGGYVVIDFIADNPGYWFLHCHIEPHQLEGMALVINEAQTEQNPPPDGMHSCGSFNWSVEEFNQKLNFTPKISAQMAFHRGRLL